MARTARFFRQDEIDLVEEARACLARDPDTNALDDQALISEVERRMPFDAVKERRKKAERIVRDQERPRKTEPDGSAWLPGFEPAPYEPKRLMPDGEGKTVERDLATPHFIAAAVARSDENLQRQMRAHKRTKAEADEFAEWAADQAIDDRKSNEITFGNFVREKGYWRPDPVEPPDDDGE